ncbi:MAG TPA: methyltransferase domain-containing protein, partial [Chloroflexota bacterium]|nr:methyltransferase domain-containing protein [Chloroflexota bacterium]
MLSDDEILVWLRAEYAKPFAGWDFSYLLGRRQTLGDMSWDFSAVVRDRLSTATRVLDVDTGDGRRFAEVLTKGGFRGRASATEGYPPNVPLARATLEPLGVEVYEATGAGLPFPDASFDLIVNRHGLLAADETQRVVKPGGWLVTEQVGSRANLDIHHFLDAPLPKGPEWDLATATSELETRGFQVHRAEEQFPIT